MERIQVCKLDLSGLEIWIMCETGGKSHLLLVPQFHLQDEDSNSVHLVGSL